MPNLFIYFYCSKVSTIFSLQTFNIEKWRPIGCSNCADFNFNIHIWRMQRRNKLRPFLFVESKLTMSKQPVLWLCYVRLLPKHVRPKIKFQNVNATWYQASKFILKVQVAEKILRWNALCKLERHTKSGLRKAQVLELGGCW